MFNNSNRRYRVMIIMRMIHNKDLTRLAVKIMDWEEEKRFTYLVADIGNVWVWVLL